MFNKLKLRKAPLSLNSVSNAIKNAGSSDLSPSGLSSKMLNLAVADEKGLPKNSILAVAFDPVQSLLAVSTINNEVRIYGQGSVEVVFSFKSSSPITILRFVKGVYLVGVLPSSGGITVLSLHSKSILASYSPPGSITTVESDPAMDWLIIGLANGGILFYDVDRLNLTPFRIDNLQKKILPKHKLSPVLNIEWHPRDVGCILVTYSHAAVVYDYTSETIKASFVYQLTKGARGFDYSSAVANGGKKKLFGSSKEVIPEMVEAHFHPNGLHVVSVHVDNSLVFWDANDGTLLESRSVFETNLHKSGLPVEPPANLFPILSVRWIAGLDPELTQLVVAGGDPHQPNIIHILDFGLTLKYSLTSHEKQGQFYALPTEGQRAIPVTFNENLPDKTYPEEISTVLPIAADGMPYFNGNHNPACLLVLSNHGSIYFLPFEGVGGGGFRAGLDMSSLLIPPSLAMVNPPVVTSTVQQVKRVEWFGIISTRASGGAAAKSGSLLSGGAQVNHTLTPRPVGADENYRDILITAHQGGMIRMLDVSRDSQDNCGLLQISLSDTLYDNGDTRCLKIIAVSCLFETRELIAGMANGHVVICKYEKLGHNPVGQSSRGNDYRDSRTQHQNGNAKIIDIKGRVLGTFASSTTFLPVSLLQLDSGDEISCLKMSNVGFAAIAYKSGRLVVCDISRGPAVILNCETIKQHIPSVTTECSITTMEFSIMEYGQDGYSSIVLMVGTNAGGNLLLFKIIPQPNGAFTCVFTDKTLGLNYKVLGGEDPSSSKLDRIIPLNANTGEAAVASMEIFQKLSHGVVIPGLIVITSNKDIRVLKVPKVKLSHKVVEDSCLACGVVKFKGRGVLLATLVKSGFIKLSSLPALNDIADIKLLKDTYEKVKKSLETEASRSSDIVQSGDVFLKLSESEFVKLSIYTDDQKVKTPKGENGTDLLFNENAIIPPRPTAGAMQWARGQAKITTSADVAFLIAGPNRKPAKHPESALAHNISPEANPNAVYGYGSGGGKETNDRGYKEPVRKGNTPANHYAFGADGFMRSLQSGITSVEESLHGYANDMSEAMTESVEGSKTSFYKAAFQSKFGI